MSFLRRKDEGDGPGAEDERPDEPVAPPPRVEAPRPRGTLVARPLAADGSRLGGRIVSPRGGETLGGVVEVEVQAAELDGGIERIEVEYSADGERWRPVGGVQDEPYDLVAILDEMAPLHVAVVRSWRLAEFFRIVLEQQPELGFERIDVRPSDVEAWERGGAGSSSWNTNGIGDGAYRVRAATIGRGGERVLTPEVRVEVRNGGPEVVLVAPVTGAELTGVSTLRARVGDAGTGIERVVFEHSRDRGATWIEVGTRAAEPWEVDWPVDDVPATEVRLRVRVVDARGHEHAGPAVTVQIATPPPQATLGALPAQLRGRATLAATVDSPERVEEVQFQLAEEGSDAWLTIATAVEPPYEALFDTTVLADGRYELRASILARSGARAPGAVRPHRIDNSAPVVRLDVPDNGFVNGTVHLEARAHDEGSGVELIAVELRPEDGRWTELARAEDAGILAHSWDTTKLPDGHYDVRVVARDGAGNERRPELVALVLDNTPPHAEIVEPEPDARVSGVVPIGAEILDTCSGLAWLRYEWSAGDGEWHELPRDAGSVTWRSVEVPDGEYELRVRAADRAGNTTTSESITVVVENEALQAAREEEERARQAEAAAAQAEAERDPEPEDEAPEAAPTRFGFVPAWLPADDAEPEGDEEPDAEEEEPVATRVALTVVPEPEPEPAPEEITADPEPEPEPELDLEPVPEESIAALPRRAGSWSLWELDRLAEEHAADDPARAEERRAVLYFLRDHAALDGTIPSDFEDVVRETFGDLL